MANVLSDVKKNASWRSLGRHNDILLAVLIIAVIALMVLPLPPFVLDTLIAINITISVILLMVAMYINSPLGLSTFPSLLLFTTLFRLSLNIASTRQILLNAYAGEIIYTFGNMVVGGDIIVGAVVFLIIAIVQFIVIAKGAERIAEVGARFTLDAMPGKQMSIDADLRAGIIDKDEARMRRTLLERESHLYGSMDGAMKFVKGDAIAGLIIAAVNILAGVAIGVLRKGMDMDTALRTYSVLTVGDALVSQIPSLFVSIAAGIIITRVGSPDGGPQRGLGDEIAQQITAHPKALLIGAGVVFGLMWVPGFPKIQFLLLAVGVGTAGYYLLPSHRRYETPGATPMPALRKEGTDKVPMWLDSSDHALTVPIAVKAFSGFERTVMPTLLEPELAKARRHLSFDLGVPFPGIVMQTAERLQKGIYKVYVHEIPVDQGELRPGHVLVLESEANLMQDKAIKFDKGDIPMLGKPALWASLQQVPLLERGKHRFYTLEQALGHHLMRIMRRHADSFVGIQESQFLLKRLSDQYPDLEKELTRNVPLPRFTEVLKRLVREEISIRDLRAIAHGLIEWAPREKDTVLVTEYVRTSLSRYISHRFSSSDGSLPAIVLHPQLEDQLRQSMRQTSAGVVLMLDPSTNRQLIEKIKQALSSAEGSKETPVLLTSLEIRPYLRKLTEVELARVPVLSYQELEPTVKVVSVASVSL